MLEFATALQQLTHREFVELPAAYIQTDATSASIDEIRDPEVKQQHLVGGGGTGRERGSVLGLDALAASVHPGHHRG